MPQPRNSFFIWFSALRPASPSKLNLAFLIIGAPCDHISACMNQLPVMFQPQNMPSLPIFLIFSQAVMTSSQVVGIFEMPAAFKMSML